MLEATGSKLGPSKVRSDSGLFASSAAISVGIAVVGMGSMIAVVMASISADSAANAAAQSAARAATLEQTPFGAEQAAQDALEANAENVKATCQLLSIEMGELAPGDAVTIVVDCVSNDAGFGQWATLGRSYEGEATEIVDVFRTGGAS